MRCFLPLICLVAGPSRSMVGLFIMVRKPILAAAITLAAGIAALPAWAGEPGDWTGYYAGVNLGAAMGTAEMGLSPSGAFFGPTAIDISDGNFWRGSRDLDSTDLTSGVQAGYQQAFGRYVLGVEADIGYLGLEDSASVTAFNPGSGGTYRLDQKMETDLFASLRPRLGYVPEALSNDLLLFVTGGVTLTRAKVEQTFTQLNAAYSSQGLREEKTLLGWTAGAGMEYALSRQWSLKGEYSYADLGTIENNGASGNAGFANYTTDNKAELSAHMLRLGLSFRF